MQNFYNFGANRLLHAAFFDNASFTQTAYSKVQAGSTTSLVAHLPRMGVAANVGIYAINPDSR